jgi:hypothetical protein
VELAAPQHASLSMFRQPSADAGQNRNVECELPTMGNTGTITQPDTEPLPAAAQLLPTLRTSPSNLYFPTGMEIRHAGGEDSTAGASNWYGISHVAAGPLCERSGKGGATTYGGTFSSCVADLRINETCDRSELDLFGRYSWN